MSFRDLKALFSRCGVLNVNRTKTFPSMADNENAALIYVTTRFF